MKEMFCLYVRTRLRLRWVNSRTERKEKIVLFRERSVLNLAWVGQLVYKLLHILHVLFCVAAAYYGAAGADGVDA